MELTLAPNPLYNETQILNFDKVATLIGENGSGKSTILHSVFKSRVEGTEAEQGRLICFTSGQNENFSDLFVGRLNKIRRHEHNDDIDFGCLYFSKSDVQMLIFLASTFFANGFVRKFLESENYVIVEDGHDQTSSFSLNLSVRKEYLERIRKDEEAEAKDFNHPSIRKRPFNRRLETFIDKLPSLDNFDDILQQSRGFSERTVIVTCPQLFEIFDGSKIDAVKFFIEGSFNSYFFSSSSNRLSFKNGLEFSSLSDGEYQLLFLYALIDLFDSEEALFLLDEADSHLHYTNIAKLWATLKDKVKGRTITTTHLLDSIAATGISNIQVVSGGKISQDDKFIALTDRLNQLGYVQNAQFRVCSLIENIVLIDDPDDWIIFRMLAEKKLGRTPTKLNGFQIIKKESNYEQHTCGFGKSKIFWAGAFAKKSSEWDLQTKTIFLICDRDNLPDSSIDKRDGVSVNGEKEQPVEWSCRTSPKVHLLSWRQREIENYLLCFSALNAHNKIEAVNTELSSATQLKINSSPDCDQVRNLDVKEIIAPLVKPHEGLCLESLQAYIDLIPPDEISEDIENMYNFIVSKL